MTEARQHNTEIRMAISKVVDKMDHLAAKVMYGRGRAVNKLTAPQVSAFKFVSDEPSENSNLIRP